MGSSRAGVTQLLEQARQGDLGARDALFDTIQTELRVLAAGHLAGERRGHSLQRTDLVHEVCLRLLEGEELPGSSRAQFLSYVSRAMRHILVDHAKARKRLKRGGDKKRVPLADGLAVVVDPDLDLLALDEALNKLAQLDERKGRVVELRYFGGLRVEEVAEALGISVATVKRDWEVARSWLHHEVKGDSRTG